MKTTKRRRTSTRPTQTAKKTTAESPMMHTDELQENSQDLQIKEFWERSNLSYPSRTRRFSLSLRMPTIRMKKLLRQKSMMTRSAKTSTLFIVLLRGGQQETHYWRPHCLLESSRLRESCRTSNSRNSICPVFLEATRTGSFSTIVSREQ